MEFLNADDGEVLLTTDGGFPQFESSQKELIRRTGVHVDPYADTMLAPNHAGIWAASLEELLPTVEHKGVSAACRKIIAVLRHAEVDGIWLKVVGD